MKYIDLPASERKKHLKLDTPCKERGGYSTMFRGLLADFLETDIFVDKKIVLCHACHNAKCSNTEHLYWGTYQDNIDDQIANGTWKTVWEEVLKNMDQKKPAKEMLGAIKQPAAEQIKVNLSQKNTRKRLQKQLKESIIKNSARVVKQVDTSDLKSDAIKRLAGSIPASSTKLTAV